MAGSLSVAASIAGLFSLSGQLIKVVGPYVSATTEDVPQIAREVHSELQSTEAILQALYELINKVEERNFENESLIRVDHLSAALTDGVMVLSEFTEVIGTMIDPAEHDARLRLKPRLEWAWKESSLSPLLRRLQGFKSSVSMMLNIPQS